MNILDTILTELQGLKETINSFQHPITTLPPEIIDGAELCNRLDISEPTLIKWRYKNKIPFIKLDSVIRYNWPEVVKFLEKK